MSLSFASRRAGKEYRNLATSYTGMYAVNSTVLKGTDTATGLQKTSAWDARFPDSGLVVVKNGLDYALADFDNLIKEWATNGTVPEEVKKRLETVKDTFIAKHKQNPNAAFRYLDAQVNKAHKMLDAKYPGWHFDTDVIEAAQGREQLAALNYRLEKALEHHAARHGTLNSPAVPQYRGWRTAYQEYWMNRRADTLKNQAITYTQVQPVAGAAPTKKADWFTLRRSMQSMLIAMSIVDLARVLREADDPAKTPGTTKQIVENRAITYVQTDLPNLLKNETSRNRLVMLYNYFQQHQALFPAQNQQQNQQQQQQQNNNQQQNQQQQNQQQNNNQQQQQQNQQRPPSNIPEPQYLVLLTPNSAEPTALQSQVAAANQLALKANSALGDAWKKKVDAADLATKAGVAEAVQLVEETGVDAFKQLIKIALGKPVDLDVPRTPQDAVDVRTIDQQAELVRQLLNVMNTKIQEADSEAQKLQTAATTAKNEADDAKVALETLQKKITALEGMLAGGQALTSSQQDTLVKKAKLLKEATDDSTDKGKASQKAGDAALIATSYAQDIRKGYDRLMAVHNAHMQRVVGALKAAQPNEKKITVAWNPNMTVVALDDLKDKLDTTMTIVKDFSKNDKDTAVDLRAKATTAEAEAKQLQTDAETAVAAAKKAVDATNAARTAAGMLRSPPQGGNNANPSAGIVPVPLAPNLVSAMQLGLQYGGVWKQLADQNAAKTPRPKGFGGKKKAQQQADAMQAADDQEQRQKAAAKPIVIQQSQNPANMQRFQQGTTLSQIMQEAGFANMTEADVVGMIYENEIVAAYNKIVEETKQVGLAEVIAVRATQEANGKPISPDTVVAAINRLRVEAPQRLLVAPLASGAGP